MYAITYHMQSGATLHRAPSAQAALELMSMIVSGGGAIDRIVVTRTGQPISLVELNQLADGELSAAQHQAPQSDRRRGRWWRRTPGLPATDAPPPAGK